MPTQALINIRNVTAGQSYPKVEYTIGYIVRSNSDQSTIAATIGNAVFAVNLALQFAHAKCRRALETLTRTLHEGQTSGIDIDSTIPSKIVFHSIGPVSALTANIGCGFNRSTQHTRICVSRRSVADDPKITDQLYGKPEGADVGTLAAR
jgi:aspartate ammonia-lyase